MSPLINLESVSVFYKDFPVLTGVNLSVEKGEMVYLIGKTGSGKSSLLRTLYCDLALKEGNAHIAGYDLRKINRREIPHLRRKLGIVFQDFQLLTDRNVYANLHFVMKATGWKKKNEIDERIKTVLAAVGLDNKINKMPYALSGGEQQRVAIARALLNEPEIILADEPTGNLDPAIAEEIIRIQSDLSHKGRTIIIATHNYSLIEKFPSRTVRCEEGTVREGE
ncbi:MAG: ATP-binding cassette domain-containing protein [Bacteroidetes bacterium]|nr:ATP-binding cassette domain-containing protein [Bacteroidota bacterium]